ncbi:MAG: hypothetical protein P4L95_12895 [Rouxiella aceris]|uniref:hypothetical protein n=1 Tax=Rouxiella aceris TaxID=2703884 RepID=UPI0028452C1F|nr:hypothetical protein [Rouxiella aceris]MDR3432779.1 hypothetical protein [Rouxiella aceris]
MKLPRYLQIALLITGLLVLYSLIGDEEPASMPLSVINPLSQNAHTRSADQHHRQSVSESKSDDFIDLFPSAIKSAALEQSQEVSIATKQSQRQEAAIVVPPLPFQLVGAWWSNHQRTLMLQAEDQQWIICRRCRAAKRVWTGMKLTDDWQLKSVSADSLTFIWLPQMQEQHLALGDMKSEPKFNYDK